ncbi:MAG TPA: hypothetical protein VLC71_10085 [Thermomonas sp.]|nr:hypothetical protein [Thermomonas sp.]
MALPNDSVRISSITAAEFLLIQAKDASKANYYPILPSRLNHAGQPLGLGAFGSFGFDSKRHAAQGKHRTDHLVLDFGINAPRYIEFGSIAITQIVNLRYEQIFSMSISHLDKKVQKTLMKRFRFLLEIGASCVAVTPQIASVGMSLLGSFMDRYQSKKISAIQLTTFLSLLLQSIATQN